MSRRNDKTWAGDNKSFTQTLYVYDENGTDLYEENLQFSTTESYNAGYSAGGTHADSLYSKWNNGTQSSLYYWDTASLSYKQATGGGKYWFYKSSV